MSTPPAPTRPPKRWPWVAGGVVGLLAVTYGVVTSGAFIRGVVLPKAGDSLGSDIVADKVSLSPFSSLQLEGVRLTPRGAEPLLAVGSVRVRYGLFDILGGNIRVDELVVTDPAVTLVQRPDGTSNLDVLLKALPPSKERPEDASQSQPLQLAVANVRVTGGSATLTRPAPGGGTETVGIRDLRLDLDRLANGQSGKLVLGGTLAMDAGTNRVRGRLDGEIQVGLTAAAAPEKVGGGLQLAVAEAAGAWQQLGGLGARLSVDVTTTELKDLRLEFSQGGTALGRVGVRGTYDLARTEAQLAYELGGIDRRVLALAGAALGMDLRETSVEARGRVDVTQQGGVLGSSGNVRVARLSVDLGQGATPELDVQSEYKVTLNQAQKSVLIDTLKIDASQAGRTVVTSALDRPMNLAWDQAAPGFRESTLSLKVVGLQLAEWRPILGPTAPGGRLSADVRVKAERDGRLLQVTVDATADQLEPGVATENLRDAVVSVKTSASLADFTALEVSRYAVEVTRAGSALVSVTGVADWHRTQGGGGAQFAVNGSVPALLALMPVEGVEAARGTVTANGRAGLAAGRSEVVATLGVEDFTGTVSGMRFADYDANLQVNAGLQDTTARLDRFNLGLRSGLNAGGNVEASGTYDLKASRGRIEFKVLDLNEHALAPVLDPALAPRRLASVRIAAAGTAEVDLQGASRVRTQVQIAGLKAEEAPGRGTLGPLGLELGVDAAAEGMRVDLGEVRLNLGKTDRAANELTLRGKLDLTATNAGPSTLEIRSTGLDLTPLYEMFAGGGTNTPAAAQPAAPAGEPGEPGAVTLPIRRLTADLDIARVHLREVEVADWKARLEVTNSRVLLKPFALSLNGAPVTASVDADLGVPGYRYQLGFDAASVPLAPLVNSFVPDRRGQISGTAVARVNMGGAGVTGANLERNLRGDFGVVATNLNLKLADVRLPVIRTVVNVVLGLPSLIRSASNPAAFLETLAGRLTGQAPGWVDEFTRSPLDVLHVDGRAGDGRISVSEGRVVSPAFVARTAGTITLQPILTNSPVALPIQLALREDLGRQVGVKSAATNGYVALPEFVSLSGTLGQPKAEIDKTRLVLMGGQAVLGLAGDAGAAAGGLVGEAVGAVKGLLGGGTATNAPAARTNSPLGGILKAIGGGERPAADTNAPAAPKANPLDILGIGRPKKP